MRSTAIYIKQKKMAVVNFIHYLQSLKSVLKYVKCKSYTSVDSQAHDIIFVLLR